MTDIPQSSPLGVASPEAAVGKRILLVDDHADTVRSLSMLLRMWKYDVQSASDGPTAISLAREFLPQIILLDIGLPVMNGYEVAAQIRACPELSGVVLVAMTGFGGDDARRRSVEAGFDHHLLKPVSVEQLKELLATL